MTEKEQPPSRELAEALACALQILDEHGREAVDAYLAELSGCAPDVRARLSMLERVGMVGDVVEHRRVPEKLGEFILGEELGSGGMGVVLRAFQPSLGRDVAVKMIRPDCLWFDQARERFHREIEAVSKLEHAGVVRVYAAGEDRGVPFFVMERVEGISLDRLLALLQNREPTRLCERDVKAIVGAELERTAPPESAPRGLRWSELCCRWLRDLAVALDHAHAHGVLHRDVKPSNVMVTPELEVKLLDFGLASTRESSSITKSASRIGSLPYMAPEQVRGDHEAVDERTDVYGLGVTFYELVTLRNPFLRSGENEERLRQSVLDGVVAPMRAANPAASWDAETVASVAMEGDPARRYQSAAALAADAANALALRPIAARRAGAVRRLRRWAARRPAWAVGMTLGSLLFIAAPTAFAIRERVLRGEITLAKADADAELETQREILRFLNDDLLGAVAPDEVGRAASMLEVVDVAAQRIAGRFTGRPHVEAAIRQSLGNVYTLLGKLDLAEPHLTAARDLFVQHRGSDHEHALEARRDLARLYRRQDRLQEAEALLRDVFETLRASRGFEDDDTLKAANDLALVWGNLARYDEAEALLRVVVDVRLREYDEESALTPMSNLGLVIYESGRPREAEPWVRRELEAAKRVYHENHPDLLTSLANWANLQDTLGNHEEAMAVREDLVRRHEAVHGPRHPKTIDRLVALAQSVATRRDYEAAERLLEDALARCVDLPADHRMVLTVRTHLANVYSLSHHPDKALAAVEGLLETYGPSVEAPRRQSWQWMRVKLLMDLKRWEEAERRGADLVATSERAGLGGTVTAAAHLMYGLVLLGRGRHAEAADALLSAEGLYAEYAPRHGYVPLIHRRLIELYESWGKPEEAASWRRAREQWQAAGTDRDDP